jgi:hypothetical protein
MTGFDFVPIVGITVICGLAAEGAKAAGVQKNWLPVICGVVGGALGVVAMNIAQGFPAGDFITAAAIGITSGLAAAGGHQAVKQLRDDKWKL